MLLYVKYRFSTTWVVNNTESIEMSRTALSDVGAYLILVTTIFRPKNAVSYKK